MDNDQWVYKSKRGNPPILSKKIHAKKKEFEGGFNPRFFHLKTLNFFEIKGGGFNKGFLYPVYFCIIFFHNWIQVMENDSKYVLVGN